MVDEWLSDKLVEPEDSDVLMEFVDGDEETSMPGPRVVDWVPVNVLMLCVPGPG
jgi:hypothetical protein